MNREEWLNQAAEELNYLVAETDLHPHDNAYVSTGWPRRDRGGKVIGQCWGKQTNGTRHIFVSPLLGTAAQVLPVLLHELIHAADNCESGHKGAFRKAWKAVGFTGKPTESTPGPELKARLREIEDKIGRYPHAAISTAATMAKPQTTRMLKIECPECGCILRMTQKWLDEAGEPRCGCGTQMEQA